MQVLACSFVHAKIASEIVNLIYHVSCNLMGCQKLLLVCIWTHALSIDGQFTKSNKGMLAGAGVVAIAMIQKNINRHFLKGMEWVSSPVS
jgi:hypothetical protein